jgi:prefoldin subunit 5
MAPTYIDEIKKLKEEIDCLQQRIQYLQGKINRIQLQCKHIFLETTGMRTCQKCGFTESTYY